MMSDEEVQALHLTRGKFSNTVGHVGQDSSDRSFCESAQMLPDIGMIVPYCASIERST